MERLIMTPKEVAEALGTTNARIQVLLTSGEIPAYREGRNWKIPKTLLHKYIEERAARETAERRANG